SSLTTIRARRRGRAPNENVLRGFSPDNDSPNVPTLATHFCSCLITQADLLSRSRSSSLLSTHHETRVDRQAFRKESRRMKRCQTVDQQAGLSIVRAPCNRLFPSPHPDLYRHAESEHLFATDCRPAG